jgi:hypothetical protein
MQNRRAVASPCSASCCNSSVEVKVLTGSAPDLPEGAHCTHLINYDLPASGREYVRRLASFTAEREAPKSPSSSPQERQKDVCICYTFVEEAELKSRRCKELVGVLRRAQSAASKSDEDIDNFLKAIELDSALLQLSPEENDWGSQEDDEDEDDESGLCDCIHCQGRSVASVSYHEPPAVEGTRRSYKPQVEVVHLHLRGLEAEGEAWDSLVALTAPKLNHACTLVSLHPLYSHTPWDGYEHHFAALPPGTGAVRVILVLAEQGSWHDYPDCGTFAGGVAWVDILDMDSMDRTDRLLEKLVDHEVALLGGESERLVLMGSSQGGGQSMLRFLRSRHRLGGFLGAVCHVPTEPHAPFGRDPLVEKGRPSVNLDRPIRILSGMLDSTFPLPLVLRDVTRLRDVGGFRDVEVEVLPDHQHEGPREEQEAEKNGEEYSKNPPAELEFLHRVLPLMVPLANAKGGNCLPPAEAPPSQESRSDASSQ